MKINSLNERIKSEFNKFNRQLMKPLSQKPPLVQKKPTVGLAVIFSPSKQKDMTFRYLPRTPQIFNDDNAFNKKQLDIRDVYNNIEFASHAPVKPKSQPHSGHSGPENLLIEGNVKGTNKIGLRDSIKRTNTIIASPSKILKTEESERPETHKKLSNIFKDNAQRSLEYKQRENSPVNINIRDVEYRMPAPRDKSPYANRQVVHGPAARPKVLPRMEMSPIKSRQELSSLNKDDSWSKKELKYSNMTTHNQKSKLTLPKMPTVVNHISKNASPRQLHFVEQPRKSALVVLDHDLGFIKDHISGFVVPWNVCFEKMENIGAALENEDYEDRYGLTSYHAIFVFIKFSPRVKRQSLKVLQTLARSERCFVVKCVLDVESVDLHLDYENPAITVERKKYMEHTLFLERESFDSFSLGHDTLISLETFLNCKIKVVQY